MMRRCWTAIVSVFLISWAGSAQSQENPVAPAIKDAELRVRLLAPLSTRLNRKGDLVSAAVIEPASFDGGILEGDVREVKGGSGQKTSMVQFQFHTLHIQGKHLPVNASVLNVANSKHQLGIDEEGEQLESDKGILGTGKLSSLGSALGNKLHMGGGKSYGGGGTPLRVLTRAPDLSLAVGSEMVVQINPSTGRE
jgi:hypothetical protein